MTESKRSAAARGFAVRSGPGARARATGGGAQMDTSTSFSLIAGRPRAPALGARPGAEVGERAGHRGDRDSRCALQRQQAGGGSVDPDAGSPALALVRRHWDRDLGAVRLGPRRDQAPESSAACSWLSAASGRTPSRPRAIAPVRMRSACPTAYTPMVDTVQPPAADAMRDRSAAEPEPAKLADRHEAVLSRRPARRLWRPRATMLTASDRGDLVHPCTYAMQIARGCAVGGDVVHPCTVAAADRGSTRDRQCAERMRPDPRTCRSAALYQLLQRRDPLPPVRLHLLRGVGVRQLLMGERDQALAPRPWPRTTPRPGSSRPPSRSAPTSARSWCAGPAPRPAASARARRRR